MRATAVCCVDHTCKDGSKCAPRTPPRLYASRYELSQWARSYCAHGLDHCAPAAVARARSTSPAGDASGWRLWSHVSGGSAGVYGAVSTARTASGICGDDARPDQFWGALPALSCRHLPYHAAVPGGNSAHGLAAFILLIVPSAAVCSCGVCMSPRLTLGKRCRAAVDRHRDALCS
jgi:hypothetical protein